MIYAYDGSEEGIATFTERRVESSPDPALISAHVTEVLGSSSSMSNDR
jgi:hypothetical protein